MPAAAHDSQRASLVEIIIIRDGGWRTYNVFDHDSIVSRNDCADAMSKLELSEHAEVLREKATPPSPTIKGRVGRMN